MRYVRALVAALVLAALAFVPSLPADASAVVDREPCNYQPGTRITSVPWAQTRLNFQRLWSITQGAGVTVAVVDTGLNPLNPQFSGVHTAPGADLVHSGWGTADCGNHGTQVTSLIVAHRGGGSALVGVAPQATIIPIKQTIAENDKSGTYQTLAAGIETAVRKHARVINLSVYTTTDAKQVRDAVKLAHDKGVVIVAAAGNDAKKGNPVTYPAAYSTVYDNVIAVGATDVDDVVGDFSEYGDYVNVVAPGVGVQVADPGSGSSSVDGTSFSAPYVTGVVALMLGADRSLTPGQIRARLENTADSPPATTPSTHYGYGIVNPYLAVTAVGLDTPPAQSSGQGAGELKPIVVPAAPSRRLQHVALAVGLGLLGLAVVVVALAGVWRTAARARRPRSA